MSENLRKTFKKNGYVHLRGVLGQSEIAAIRKGLPPHFRKLTRKPKCYLQARECLKIPKVYDLMVNPAIVEACRAIFSPDIVYVNDLVVQRNILPERDISPHLDCQAEYRMLNGAPHLLNPDFLFAKIGVYLQDNTVQYGGGIDIYNRGHRFAGNGIYFNYPLYKRFLRPYMTSRMNRIDTKTGDVLIFDCRLPHRSTAPQGIPGRDFEIADEGIMELPEDKSKYVVYWEVTRRGDEKYFVECAKRRAVKEEMVRPVGTYRPRCGYLGLNYPDDYPKDLISKLNADGLRIFSLPPEQTGTWNKAFDGS